MKKIVLFIMTKKGFEVLQRAIEINQDLIEFVVVGSDSNINNDFSDEIITLAKKTGIDFFKRGSEPIIEENLYIISISWRWMINHPAKKLIIFHDSILPKYRGFAPLVNMLINGERKVGVSAIFGAKEYDRGDLIAQESSDINYPITISEAIEINNKNLLKLFTDIICKISNGDDLVGLPQNEADASYSIWRDKEDYFIDWNKSAEEIRRLVDAVGSPYLGARSLTTSGDTIRITKVKEIDDVSCELRHVGKVIFMSNGKPVVICGKGLLLISEAHLIDAEGDVDFLPMKSFRVKFV